MESELSVPACIEALEQRRLYAVNPGAPTLTNAQLVGTLPGIDSIVLTFSGSLDPTSASNPAAYQLYHFGTLPGHSGFGIFDIGGTSDRDVRRDVSFATAVYDDTNHTVTLTPKNPPVNANIWYKTLRIKGTGVNAIRDTNGTILMHDIVVHHTIKLSRHIRFVDDDGDRVKIDMTGPGGITTILQSSGAKNPIIIFNQIDPLATIVTATVIKSRRGDGIVNVLQFAPDGLTNQNISGNPAFSIQQIL